MRTLEETILARITATNDVYREALTAIEKAHRYDTLVAARQFGASINEILDLYMEKQNERAGV